MAVTSEQFRPVLEEFILDLYRVDATHSDVLSIEFSVDSQYLKVILDVGDILTTYTELVRTEWLKLKPKLAIPDNCTRVKITANKDDVLLVSCDFFPSIEG